MTYDRTKIVPKWVKYNKCVRLPNPEGPWIMALSVAPWFHLCFDVLSFDNRWVCVLFNFPSYGGFTNKHPHVDSDIVHRWLQSILTNCVRFMLVWQSVLVLSYVCVRGVWSQQSWRLTRVDKDTQNKWFDFAQKWFVQQITGIDWSPTFSEHQYAHHGCWIHAHVINI